MTKGRDAHNMKPIGIIAQRAIAGSHNLGICRGSRKINVGKTMSRLPTHSTIVVALRRPTKVVRRVPAWNIKTRSPISNEGCQ